MDTRGKPRTGYTHFIGIEVPEPIADVVEDCRDWMARSYGCKSGYGTVPHVTLVAPFAFADPAGVGELERALGEWAATMRPFVARVEGFGSFAERTVFARVEADPAWDSWHAGIVRALNARFPRLLPPDRRPFTPHLTVANRDIPPEGVAPALLHFAELGLRDRFAVDAVTLFEWGGRSWSARFGAECAGA